MEWLGKKAFFLLEGHHQCPAVCRISAYTWLLASYLGTCCFVLPSATTISSSLLFFRFWAMESGWIRRPILEEKGQEVQFICFCFASLVTSPLEFSSLWMSEILPTDGVRCFQFLFLLKKLRPRVWSQVLLVGCVYLWFVLFCFQNRTEYPGHKSVCLFFSGSFPAGQLPLEKVGVRIFGVQ